MKFAGTTRCAAVTGVFIHAVLGSLGRRVRRPDTARKGGAASPELDIKGSVLD